MLKRLSGGSEYIQNRAVHCKMQYASLREEIAAYVISLFRQHPVPGLLYHNLEHTCQVVRHSGEIALHYHLTPDEQFIVFAAAWFHDTGHLIGDMKQHEERGCILMRRFLEEKQVPAHMLEKIAGCIMATQYPPHPRSLPEEIICDADTYHFGTSYFKTTDELVRQELEIRLHFRFTSWHRDTLTLLQKHRFFTGYCRQLLEAGKQQNIEYLQKKIITAQN